MNQNLMVIKEDAENYVTIKDLTHDMVCRSTRACVALKWAVDALAAEGGGQITLGRGTFELDEPVRLADQITLRGGGRSSKLVVLPENEAGIGLLCEGTSGTTIADLAIVGRKDAPLGVGVLLDDAGDCKLRDLTIVGFAQYGVWLRNNSFLCEIRGCSLAGNAGAAIFCDDLREGRAGDYIPNLITNCMIYGGGKGIDCKNTVVLNIVGCVVFQSGDVAYHLRERSNSIVITGCRTFQITGDAVRVEETNETNITGNIFCWHTQRGIVVDDCNWGTITGNEIIDSGAYNAGTDNFTTRFDSLTDVPHYDGIVIKKSKGFTVSANALFSWDVCPPMRHGIVEDAESFRNIITGNNINYFIGQDVVSEGEGTIVSDNNSLADVPYRHGKASELIQSFQRELVEAFIEKAV